MTGTVGIVTTGKLAGEWYVKQAQIEAKRLNHPVRIEQLQVDFDRINAILPNEIAQASIYLADDLKRLGVEDLNQFILANITLHEAMDLIGDRPSNFIHIKDILKNEIPAGSKVMVLGTLYTMQSGYVSSLLKNEVTCVRPVATDEIAVDDLRKLYYKETDKALAHFIWEKLLSSYPEVDYFIIACTELALALDGFKHKERFLNLPQLQCAYLLKAMIMPIG